MEKIKVTSFLMLLIGITNIQTLFGQSWWSQSTFKTSLEKATQNETIFEIDKRMLESSFRNSPLQFSKKKEKLLMEFPDGKSGTKVYSVWRTEVLHPRLQEKYKNIVSFAGQAIDNPNELIRFTYYPNTGVKANISIPGKKNWIIEPIEGNIHRMFSSGANQPSDFECQLEEKVERKIATGFAAKNANDGKLRRYRLALSVSGDYSQFFLDGSEADDTERKEKVMVAMVNTMNRVNGIFERDFSVTMQIIPENESLIFLNPNTDPYTAGALNHQLQNTLDTDPNIGSWGYDVGHLFHHSHIVRGNAGYIACVCTNGQKGSAFTQHNDPSSDNFNLIVAHEFGHQFGGYHVQSSSGCRGTNNDSKVEPGSGSTIMSYAGICSPNVQEEQDDYFNYVNIRDVAIWTIQNSNCAEVIDTGNRPPIVDAGNDYVIPKLTPFVLEGTASDADDDTLTYCWEQNDPENPNSTDTPQPTWAEGPLFRSRLPVDTPIRYMPRLDDVLQGNLRPTWEVLPSVSRNMQFEFTVRDNFVGGGQTNTDTMNVEVDGNAGPFVVTSQTTHEVWNIGEEVTVTWDVANTNTGLINATKVDILLSVDGGYTYPYLIQDDITNDGKASFFLENIIPTNQARIMVRASDNIFFALNSTNFEVVVSDFVITTADSDISVCSNEDAAYTLDYKTVFDFEEEVSFSAQNLPDEIMASFSPLSISERHIEGTQVNLTLSNIETLEVGKYEFVVKGTSLSGIEKNLDLSFYVFESGIQQSTLLYPVDEQSGVDTESNLEWSSNRNIDHYIVEVAIDENFNNIIQSFETSSTSYTTEQLNHNSIYFWRVQSINPCEEIISEVFSFSTTCAAPLFLEYAVVGPSYININWEDDVSTNWDVQYGTSGFTLGEGTIFNINEKKYEASSLESLTSYDFYIRSTCAIGETGIWIGPLTVSTTENYCAGDRFYDSGGADGPYQNNETITTVISPESPEDRVKVVFESFDVEEDFDYLYVFDGPNDSFPLLGKFTGQSNIGTFLSSHETGSLTFIFVSDHFQPAKGWDASIFCVPKLNCLEPKGITAEMIELNTVDIVWENSDDASSWEIEYGSPGFVLGEGTKISVMDSMHTLTNLSSGTFYEAYVRAICDANEVSEWSRSIQFVTKSDYCNGDRFYDSGGADGSYKNDETITTVISPESPEDRVRVVFESFDVEEGPDFLSIYDGPNDSFPLLGEFTGQSNIGTFISSHQSGSLTFVFESDDIISADGWEAIVICESRCDAPKNVVISEVDNTSAKVSWDMVATDATWRVEYGTAGFTVGSGMSNETSDNFFNIEGLVSGEYEVYVKTLCSDDTESYNVGPIPFTIQGVLDTPEVNLNNAIEITPNPNKGVFMLSYGGVQVLDQIQVFDFTGRLVFDKDLSTFNKTEKISLSNPEAEIYLVQIIAAEKIITKKILVE